MFLSVRIRYYSLIYVYINDAFIYLYAHIGNSDTMTTNNYKQTLLTLEVVEGVDMNDFRFRFTTGRLMNDYEVMKLLDGNTLTVAYGNLFNYLNTYHSLASTPLEELEAKGWVTSESRSKAKALKKMLA